MKLNNTATAFVGAFALASATLMPAVNAGSKVLDTYQISGDEWKVKLKNNTTLRFNKNGSVKCSNNIADYVTFMGCVTGKVGYQYYDRVFSAIESSL